MGMNRANLELHIDQLVLHDLDLAQRLQLAAAIERALVQLFAERGMPGNLNAETLALDVSTIQVRPGAKADAIGAQVAQTIYSQIAGSQPQASLTEQGTK